MYVVYQSCNTFHTDHYEALFLISQHPLEGHLKKKHITKQIGTKHGASAAFVLKAT